MPPDAVPPEIRAIADARSDARRARDWATADRLKGELEAAGWKVIDAASLYTLERAAPPDVEVGGSVRYGSTASVPSRLDDAPVGVATVVIVATDDVAGRDPPGGGHRRRFAGRDAGRDRGQRAVGRGRRALGALDRSTPRTRARRASRPRSSGPRPASARPRPGTRGSGGPRRRSSCCWDPGSSRPRALVPAIVAALEDPTVAVAGPSGSCPTTCGRSAPRRRTRSTSTRSRATRIGFRRADAAARGLLDEHFVAPDHLDTWWSLVLRDPADDEDEDAEPRRAVQVPVELGHAGVPRADDDADPARARLAKRNFYRFLKRFATRRDLIGSAARRRRLTALQASGVGAGKHPPAGHNRWASPSLSKQRPRGQHRSPGGVAQRGLTFCPRAGWGTPAYTPAVRRWVCIVAFLVGFSGDGYVWTARPRIPVPVERLLDPRRPDPAIPEAAWWRTS